MQVQCTELADGRAAGSLVALSLLLLARRDVHTDADFLIAGFAGESAAGPEGHVEDVRGSGRKCAAAAERVLPYSGTPDTDP